MCPKSGGAEVFRHGEHFGKKKFGGASKPWRQDARSKSSRKNFLRHLPGGEVGGQMCPKSGGAEDFRHGEHIGKKKFSGASKPWRQGASSKSSSKNFLRHLSGSEVGGQMC